MGRTAHSAAAEVLAREGHARALLPSRILTSDARLAAIVVASF
jgi:hypothetical protein